MKNKFFDKKKISGLAKKNLLIVLFTLFICLGVVVSAYLSSDAGTDTHWIADVTHLPSTPTPTLVPDTGWWSTIATPTSRPAPTIPSTP